MMNPDGNKLQFINDDGILEMTEDMDRCKISAEIKEAIGLDRHAQATHDELRKSIDKATAYVRYDRLTVEYVSLHEAIGVLKTAMDLANGQPVTWTLKQPSPAECNNNSVPFKPSGKFLLNLAKT